MSGNVKDARLFDDGSLTGVTEWYHYDDLSGGFTIQSTQDVEPLLELNKNLWNDSEKHSRYGEWSRVASIPAVIVMELAKQGILTAGGSILDAKRFRAWLNDRDNLLFRTRAGRV